jgi:hypothetical protein
VAAPLISVRGDANPFDAQKMNPFPPKQWVHQRINGIQSAVSSQEVS